jgi:mRNA-degrading endonuclease RelE of RelBE toxin-antitoxin system
MAYAVVVKNKVLKNLRRLPPQIVDRFTLLAETLRQFGPTGPHAWMNYSKLEKDKYHCHLTYHYVACWQCEQGTITIEVYYVGSREDAPY